MPFAWEELDREAEMMPQPQPWEAETESARESADPAPQMALEHAERDDREAEFGVVPTAETEEGIPYTSEAERVLEEAAADAPSAHRGEPEAAPSPLTEEDGLPAGDRPANPRRGWWQRFTQS